jgi:hypothetical protein
MTTGKNEILLMKAEKKASRDRNVLRGISCVRLQEVIIYPSLQGKAPFCGMNALETSANSS